MLDLIKKILPGRKLPPGDPSKIVIWKWMMITDPEGDPYLDRLYIFRCPWVGFMLHWIRAADFDRTPHNHPWGITKKSSFWSFVVRGSYTEELQSVVTVVATQGSPMGHLNGKKVLTGVTSVTHKAGHWHAFGLDDVHRISECDPRTITFVVSGKKRSGWGFWVETEDDSGTGKIVSWRDYLDSQGRNGNGAR